MENGEVMIRKAFVLVTLIAQVSIVAAHGNGFFNDDCCNNKCRYGWYSSCPSCTRNINTGEARPGCDTCPR